MSAIASQITSLSIFLFNCLFRRSSKKTSKLCVTGLCAGNSPGTGEFPAQMASNAENVSLWWRHHFMVLWVLASHILIYVQILLTLKLWSNHFGCCIIYLEFEDVSEYCVKFGLKPCIVNKSDNRKQKYANDYVHLNIYEHIQSFIFFLNFEDSGLAIGNIRGPRIVRTAVTKFLSAEDDPVLYSWLVSATGGNILQRFQSLVHGDFVL